MLPIIIPVAHQDTDRPITDPSIQVAADSADPPAGGPGKN